jgi:hypothetical protein
MTKKMKKNKNGSRLSFPAATRKYTMKRLSILEVKVTAPKPIMTFEEFMIMKSNERKNLKEI